MPSRTRVLGGIARRERPVLLWGVGLVSLAVASLFIGMSFLPARAAEQALPRGMQNFLGRLQADAEFNQCVAAMPTPTDAELAERIVGAGLVDELYAEVVNRLTDSETLLAGFKPTSTNAEAVRAEKALFMLTAAMKRGGESEETEEAVKHFFRIVNRAQGSPCKEPDQDAELRANVKALEPMLEEAHRVKTCATAEMERRGLDANAALELLQRDPDLPQLRAHVMRLIDSKTEPPADQRAKLDGEDIATVVQVMGLFSAMTMDIDAMTHADGTYAVYLDRALNAGCKPNKALVQFLGVPSRAN